MCMQLIRRLENSILGCLNAIWKRVLLGLVIRLERKGRQAVRRKVVVDLTGI